MHINVQSYEPVPRADKYEADVKEYWIDILTQGELRRTITEITIRQVEVVDTGKPLPMPCVGSEPGPVVPGLEDRSDSEGSDAAKLKRKGTRRASEGLSDAKAEAHRAAGVEDVEEDINVYDPEFIKIPVYKPYQP